MTCPTVTLTNGLTTGNCSGNYNDTCIYSSCVAGYYLSSNGSLTRTCNQSGVYSGKPSVCIRMFWPPVVSNERSGDLPGHEPDQWRHIR